MISNLSCIVFSIFVIAGTTNDSFRIESGKEPYTVPKFIRPVNDRAIKSDVGAMIEVNSKCMDAGLPKRYSHQTVISELNKRARSGDLKAKIRLLTTHEATGLDESIRNPDRDLHIRNLVKRLAESGDPDGMCGWSMILSRDPVEARNEKEIAFWYWKAWDYYESRAKEGDLKSMLILLELPTPAIPLIMNTDIGDRTMHWQEQAAVRGDPESMFAMGMRLTDNRFPEHIAEGVEWFQRSAKAGYWKAMLQLASYYAHGTIQQLKGEEPKPDPEKAWLWLDKAVEVTGNPEIWKKYMDEDEGDFMEGFPPRPNPIR